MDLLGRSQVAQWAHNALFALEAAQNRLNEANVFPVADSDTGTNLVLTLKQGQQAVIRLTAEAPAEEVMREFALGALMGARGNSGIIVSEFLRGFSIQLRDGEDLAACLTGAARSAFLAVAEPVAGTMLTAADEAARAAQTAHAAQKARSRATDQRSHADDVEVMLAACSGAREALQRSPAQLDVLQEQGVLDAGAYGLTMLLDALALALMSSSSPARNPDPADLPELPALVLDPAAERRPGPHQSAPDPAVSCGHSHGDGEFEVMFLVEHHTDPKAGLLARLQRIGYSVVVVGGDGVWQVHVHTDDPAAALACVQDGQARQICVRHLNDPTDEVPVVRAPGIVVATSSPGLIPDMARAGAVVLMRGDEAWRTNEVERAVVDAGMPRVVVLAREADIEAVLRVAESVGASGISVEVLQTPSDLHAVVALTAAAELLDAVPSSSGVTGRAGRRLVPGMAQAISGLGQTLTLDLAAEPVPTDLQQQVIALAAADGLGLTMVLHDGDVTPANLQQVNEALTTGDETTEIVLLDSGLPGAQMQIGML